MHKTKTLLKTGVSFTQTNANTYQTDIPLDFCFGKVAHGGFQASLLTEAVQTHFRVGRPEQEQPHAFNMHTFFFRPATAGTTEITVDEKVMGAGVSTTLATMRQKGKEVAEAHVSVTNLQDPHGVSFDTSFQLIPAPRPVHIPSLATDTDNRWVKWAVAWDNKSLLKPYTHTKTFLPIDGQVHRSLTDVWLTPMSPDDVFKTEHLGFIADLWPRMVENFCPESAWNTRALVDRALQARSSDGAEATVELGFQGQAFWYPTLSMTLEVKRLLPAEGVKWLFMRARAKEIKNGRMDAEIHILDADLELVALSHHVCLVIDNAHGPLRAAAKAEKL